MDGYIGWALYHHLTASGHIVGGCDNFSRRSNVASVGSESAIPITTMEARMGAMKSIDLATQHDLLIQALVEFQPDAVVHLAQQPSAPYSMKSFKEAQWTHRNNVEGNLSLLYAMRRVCPTAHLVKLGTMGEYGTPDCEIPEGDFTVDFRGKRVTLPFPRQAGSWYHQTKVHDTHNVRFATKIWQLRATDIMQGVVYGTWVEAMGEDATKRTRFDFDECFGTAINRFCAQAVIGECLTVYGSGHQTRGFLPLRDSLRCIELILENPPIEGQYRTINQFADSYSINFLAKTVSKLTGAEIKHVDNPRIEAEKHFYQPEVKQLKDWGYKPSTDLEGDIAKICADLQPYKERIQNHWEAIPPRTQWALDQDHPPEY
jgi:UDP-sulfoquinovose synthase